MDEEHKSKKSDDIVIRRKALIGIVSAMPILGILVAKGDIGPLVLFLLGIGVGTYIGFNFKH